MNTIKHFPFSVDDRIEYRVGGIEVQRITAIGEESFLARDEITDEERTFAIIDGWTRA